MKLERDNVEDIFNLTPLQRGMLYHYLINKESHEYFNQLILNLSGSIEVELFEQAWNYVIENNEMLRTLFRWEETKNPIQITLKNLQLNFTFYDLSRERDRNKAFDEILQTDKNERFNLEDVPFRIRLCRFDDFTHKLIISNHHILYDGWSTGIILKEFFEAYNDLYNGKGLIKKNKNKFKNFVLEIDKNKNIDAEISFWKKYLKDFEPQKIYFENREIKNLYEVELFKFQFSEELTNKINVFIKEREITLATLMYCGWGILLQRYTNCNDIAFGTVVSGRKQQIKGVENIVGLFINTIPLRFKTSKEEPINELLNKIKESLKTREKYENTSLVSIKEYSGIDLKEDIFNTIVAIENYKLDNILSEKNTPLSIDSYSINEQTNFDLTVSITKIKNLEIMFSYKKRFFNKRIIEQMAKHFEIIIGNIVNQPSGSLSDIEMLTDLEKEEILYKFNATDTKYDTSFVLHEFFERQVKKHPDRIAVSFQGKKLTYGELNQKSNQLARLLRKKGVRAESIVGIMLERSFEMIIGLMAIIKAGGAYLPIDPKYPEERISYILNDSNALLLLTVRDYILNTSNTEIIDISNPSLYQGVATDLENIITADNLAYVIYTSGSTGNPKGVMIEHGALLNKLNWMQKFYPLDYDDTVLQKTSFTFDVSVWELFWWAIAGAKVCFLQPGGEKDPRVILNTVANDKVTVIHFVPSMLTPFLEYLKLVKNTTEFKKLSSLKQVFTSGEALSPMQVNTFNDLLRQEFSIKLANLYGPTEATIEVTFFDCSSEEKYSVIPIGKPIDNIKLYIINGQNTLQPIGIAGELCITGAGVARGYLNRPDLTAEKFIDNPFGKGKMYKTGDLARWLPDGNIEFLGRLDFQVKIRGNRVELEEISNQLLSNKKVKEAVVIARTDRLGNSYLCAYIVFKEDGEINELKQYLADKLPEYMIPSYFIKLDKLPLTSSGKVNRRALPEPHDNLKKMDFAEPENIIEKKLLDIWKEILEIEKIGVTQDFFELGGHSLKATTLVLWIQREFKIKLSLSDFFKVSTIRDLAKYITSKQDVLDNNIPLTGVKDKYPLSSAQKRLFFLQMIDPENTVYNMTEVLIGSGKIDIHKLEQVFKELIKRHESLRTSFVLDGDEVYQKIQEEVDFKLDVFKIDGNDLVGFIKSFIRPFDLSRAPLFKIGLGQLDEERFILIFDIHHIISDGFSNNILIKDFIALYNDKKLPELKRTYKDYAVWQQKIKTDLEDKKEYWLNEFKEEVPVLNLLTDFIRPQAKSFKGDRVKFTLEIETCNRLNRLVAQQKITLNIALMASWFILLHKLSNQKEIMVGTVSHGRTHPDLEDIVGMFVNTLPLRLKLEKDDKLAEVLGMVKDKLLKGLENQDYQFEDLLDSLNLKRKMDRNPLFDVMFVIEDPDSPYFTLPGINLQKYDYKKDISKFDLTLFAIKTGNGIEFELEYCTDLFTRTTIENYMKYYKRIITSMVEDFNIRVSDIELLSLGEKNQLIKGFNQTEAEYSTDKTIQELFDLRAEMVPEKIALLFQGKRMTYGELKNYSDKLAFKLLNLNVKKGDIVGIMMDNSFEVIISILGVLKTGAAYLPIDPDFPESRVKFMLNDCQCKVLLTQGKDSVVFRDDFTVVDVANSGIYESRGKVVNYYGDPEDLIYIIYTSGSTGKPKGCMVKQRGVVNYVEWAIKEYIDEKRTYFPFYSSIAYDLTVTSILVPLISGQTIIIYPKKMDVLNFIINDGLSNVIKVTPTHLRLLLDLDCNNSKLEKVIVGGEQLTTELARKIMKKFGHNIEIYNEYGPTETVVGCMIHKFDAKKDKKVVVPIGVPIQNTRIYLLNEDMKICPPGVVGEIYIGGIGVSPGYINQRKLTEQSFIINPFSKNEGDKLYKTGDLGVYLNSGEIEFIGRRDTRIKIRGYRVETDEIKEVMLQYPEIKDAVIVLRESHKKDKYLCGYFVAEKSIEIQELKNYLKDKLPDYMIPSFLVRVNALPVGAGGKINVNALPEPQLVKNVIENPQNEVEEYLYDIWSKNLHITGFGVSDNFFEIGGNSFLLMKIHHQISKKYPEIRVTDYFKYPTIHELAKFILNAKRKKEKFDLDIVIKFPEEYFINPGFLHDVKDYTFKISEEIVKRLEKLSFEYGVSLESIITLVLAFILSNVSNNSIIKIQIWLNRNDNMVYSLKVDLNESNEVGDLFKSVSRELMDPEKKYLYRLEEINSLRLKKPNNTLIPFIGKREYINTSLDLTNFYDLVFIIEEEDNGQLLFVCKYNNQLLNKDKVEEFIQLYAGMLANI